MVLVDTGPLVALFDRGDKNYLTCVNILKDLHEPLITVWPVITEAMYLLGYSNEAQIALWQILEDEVIEIATLEKNSFQRMRSLMQKYNDLPMDLADAALVCTAEVHGITKVFTLDSKDFNIYRTIKGKRFTVLP